MNRLETDGDFEFHAVFGQSIAELEARCSAKLRMVLDNDGLEAANPIDDCRPVFTGNRFRVEEVPAVVQFEVLSIRQLLQGDVHLLRDRADRDRLLGRIPPQIAHQTFERTFAIRQKDRRDVFDSAVVRSL